jgi:outer membrane receptor protein involved in Fe transport
VIGDPSLPKDQQTVNHTFNTAAFVVTPVGSFGNAGPGILRGPGVENWDVAMNKRIRVGLGEKRTLQLRVEAYNVFNHTQFTTQNAAAQFNPTTGSQNNANFGAYTAAAPGRVLSFSLRFQF